MAAPIVLRDVHVPPTPPFWPPAPGWWVLVAVVVAVCVLVRLRGRGARHRRKQALARFDAAMATASTPAQRLADASELLRRAARRHDPQADRLQGEAWLAFLDSGDGAFARGDGRLLLDGPFRAEVDERQAERAVAHARTRFVDLMAAR